MAKITINMLAGQAESFQGQGVGSAYKEQVDLVSSSNLFEVTINNKKKTDIVHAHTVNFEHYLKFLTTKAIKVAYVHFLPHTLDGSIKLPKIIFYFFKKYIIHFYKKADYLVVVNPIFIQELIQYGIKEEKINYIPNFVSKETFYKKEKGSKEKIRKKLNIPKDQFVVLGVGQIQTRKGIYDFISVAKNLPDLLFVWCGGFSFGKITDGYEELEKVVKNPPSNVRFPGIIPRTEMNDMFNMADILFVPAYNELFPMIILEAVNVEIPLLLRDLELYENILFKKYEMGKDNETFIKEIKNLKDDSTHYQQSCNNSKELNIFYSKEHVLSLWIDFYKSIKKKKKD